MSRRERSEAIQRIAVALGPDQGETVAKFRESLRDRPLWLYDWVYDCLTFGVAPDRVLRLIPAAMTAGYIDPNTILQASHGEETQ